MTATKFNPYRYISRQILASLDRESIASCSEWALRYRIMGKPYPGPWTFDHHPWLRGMHDCTDEMMIGQKCAQMGYSETALNKTFYAIDIECENVLYVLPTLSPDATDFSTSRFDPALESSPHLSEMFTDVKNIGHKRAGMRNLFIRGSRSRSQLKSIPAGRLIFDEVDEMSQENIVLAFERMSGQHTKQAILLSTPTRTGYGINKYFQNSTQDHFTFTCPHCNKWTELIFPDCLVVTGDSLNDPRLAKSYVKCPLCDGEIRHSDKREIFKNGMWVPTHTGNIYRGFYINQLYSMTTHPKDIAELAIKAETNLTDEQEYYNSKGGLTHTVAGAQVTDDELNDCRKGYMKGTGVNFNAIVTMGVDVGRVLHFEVTEYIFNPTTPTIDINVASTARVIDEGHVDNFEDLDELMQQYTVKFVVVDRDPETRAALTFAKRYPGRVALCKYVSGISGKVLHYDENSSMVHVDRTAWLDLSLGRFHGEKKRIMLPANVSLEYYEQLKAPARVYRNDDNGNPMGVYVTNDSDADHMAHARNYAEIALPFAICAWQNEDIKEVYGG